MKHPFIRDGQRHPRLAAVLRGLLEIPNILIAGTYAHLQSLPDEKRQRLATGIIRTCRQLTKTRTIRSMKAVLDRADWTEPQWLENWEADCRHLGLTVSEFIQWEQMPVEQAAEFVTVQGEEHIRQALRTGRGVMILAAHLGNYFSCALANRRLGLDVCSAVRPMSVRSLEERVRKFMRGCRIQHVLIGDRLPARAAETFRRGAAFLVFVDSTLPKTRNVWVRLGGAETHVSLGPALLAIRHRVPVICLTSARVDTVRHCVTFHPPLPVTRSGDFRADATRLTQHAMDVITEGVRQWPAQWCPWDIAPIRA